MSDSMQQIEAIFHDACDLAPNKGGTYELQALLSKGGMGEVPLALNTRFS